MQTQQTTNKISSISGCTSQERTKVTWISSTNLPCFIYWSCHKSLSGSHHTSNQTGNRFQTNSHKSSLTIVVIYSARLCSKIKPSLKWLLDFSIGQRDHSCNGSVKQLCNKAKLGWKRGPKSNLIHYWPLTWYLFPKLGREGTAFPSVAEKKHKDLKHTFFTVTKKLVYLPPRLSSQ